MKAEQTKTLYYERLDSLGNEIKANTAKGEKSYFRGKLVTDIHDVVGIASFDADILKIVNDKITNTP